MKWHRNGDSIQSEAGFVVAMRGAYAPEVVDGSHFEADWEQSSNLIAAAPAMLAALEAFAAWEAPGSPMSDDDLREIFSNARDAIAAAKGTP